MPPYVAQCQFQYKTQIPRDVSVNTFWFDGPGADREADATEIFSRVATFYNDEGTGTNPVTYWFSDFIDRANDPLVVRIYDQADAKPRQPFASLTLDIEPPVGNTSLPLEVACVLSFQGVPISGTNQARRRGRVYLGPLVGQAITYNTASGQPPQLTPAFRTEVARAARTMAGTTSGGVQWGVWSRVSSTFTPVWSGWIDDDPDTQRRRGFRSTQRSIWTLSV